MEVSIKSNKKKSKTQSIHINNPLIREACENKWLDALTLYFLLRAKFKNRFICYSYTPEKVSVISGLSANKVRAYIGKLKRLDLCYMSGDHLVFRGITYIKKNWDHLTDKDYCKRSSWINVDYYTVSFTDIKNRLMLSVFDEDHQRQKFIVEGKQALFKGDVKKRKKWQRYFNTETVPFSKDIVQSCRGLGKKFKFSSTFIYNVIN